MGRPCRQLPVRHDQTQNGRQDFQSQGQLPDPPEREPDDMSSFDRPSAKGNAHYLAQHLGNPETTLVAGEHYISPVPTGGMTALSYPDLFVAFDADPAAYASSNRYVISKQGRPPEFLGEAGAQGGKFKEYR